ncbi:MAG: YdcF family protein [Candidatus Shapirobacteria bacterium]|nr:YdcF family protein [Candidatus Shapirobacteria bacterium]
MKNISIVLGYGVFTPEQTDYQNYLVTALNGCLKDQSEIILTTGGCSNKNYPQLSEAESVKNLYLELHPELSPIIITENQSLSTPQNLENSLEILNKQNITPSDINIFCDAIRSPKVFYLALSLFYPDLSEKDRLKILLDFATSDIPKLDYNIIHVNGISFSNTFELATHQIVSSMLEMHYLEYPDLQEQFIAWRKIKWGVK